MGFVIKNKETTIIDATSFNQGTFSKLAGTFSKFVH